MRRLLVCLLLAWAGPGAAHRAQLELSVRRVDQNGPDMYAIHVSSVAQAPPAIVWKVLTGYERMSEFVPDLNVCRVLARNGNEVIVEQYGTARFLFVARPVHLVVRITETPLTAIDIALVSGDMRHYASRWELVALPGGATRIVYSGTLTPDFYVPGMLGARLIRSDVERMLAAVLARIDNQQALEAQAQAR